MIPVCFFDTEYFRKSLQPFTFLRSIADIRIGILTIKEKYLLQAQFESPVYITTDYLKKLYPEPLQGKEYIFIHSAYLPEENFFSRLEKLKSGNCIRFANHVVAYKGEVKDFLSGKYVHYEEITTGKLLEKPWQIFQWNGEEFEKDFFHITQGKFSSSLSDSNKIIGNPQNVFAESGVQAESCTLNTHTGKIYIGKNVTLMEGSHIRGPVAFLNHAEVKMGAKIYGPTTIGPYCKVGGELNNVVMFGYSNKAHDGFLGNSVISEWCNLGADTNCSNLKNTYDEVKVYSYLSNTYEKSGLQFCGLLMGDHVKCSINTMFNTGTVTGICCNIFGGGFHPKHIPSFQWGGGNEWEKFQWEKLKESIIHTMKRRNILPNEDYFSALRFLYDNTHDA